MVPRSYRDVDVQGVIYREPKADPQPKVDDKCEPEVEIFFDGLGMKGWGAEAVFNAGVFSMERLKKQTMDDLLDMKFDESRCKRILDELGRQAVRVPRVMLHVDFHVDLRVCVELLVAVRSRV
jgi:hypothetical protein